MATGPAARADLSAHKQSMRVDFSTLVGELTDIVGQKLVAHIAGVRETRTVREWAGGTKMKSSSAEPRLRSAFRIARLITVHEGASVARSWFEGLNPELDDRSPASLLREEELNEVGPRILAAARSFVADAGHEACPRRDPDREKTGDP